MWLQEWIPKRHMFKGEWTTCSKYKTIIDSIVTIIGTDLFDHLMSTRILILIMNKIFT